MDRITEEFHAALNELAAHRVLDWEPTGGDKCQIDLLAITAEDAYDAYHAISNKALRVWLLLRGEVEREGAVLCQ